MEFLLKFFDLFISASKKLITYLPQSGEDVVRIFRYFSQFAAAINTWVSQNIGIDFRRILAAFSRLVIQTFNFLIDFVKALVERI